MDGNGQSNSTAEIMRRFNGAFLRHAPDELPALVAEDCVIENTAPAPDGSRHVGRAACLELWHGIAANKAASFELEDVEARGIAAGPAAPSSAGAIAGAMARRIACAASI